MSETLYRIRPIIVTTYGKSAMAESLAEHLAEKIDAWSNATYRGSREEMVLHTCWNWFSGGTTAESVAERIEAVLDPASTSQKDRD